ncbi:hypothetical protein MPTK1_6g10650 [Marchantia polymorpha subsp. ruderalis]|uniref:Uncharacterized protein n=2 Tax=Marchantia polymorpha TaxID=3197 RepID=A0AAF6BQN4_MARPO|nr:hypothetical protein MARPO_0016s0106 [Marchantia polymorpha]BBN14316.1 hypothetical protein Mp_6g10650 [Marchantia polymorpha subsp. ruderalis]PTQ45051.1 hypothetical protein MARPO_0016s0106 [Marchantia polymorpha]PTQ45052.1 hypothetical protein MARPO_0016s0106 [Marchantia polymorpha]PTQ45053.1 hypothetical protein MARPO_0016s0106 [Marchantia polymorpha]|eukprot:PTQ45050.1 hypothetical protein MARPO_0016s0106 [Marchantia polymorpha]
MVRRLLHQRVNIAQPIVNIAQQIRKIGWRPSSGHSFFKPCFAYHGFSIQLFKQVNQMNLALQAGSRFGTTVSPMLNFVLASRYGATTQPFTVSSRVFALVPVPRSSPQSTILLLSLTLQQFS